jgi:hypothetical protein
MKGSVISYLTHVPPVKGEAYDQAPFDFRIHHVDDVKNDEAVWAQVRSDRGEIPPECYIDWYR